MCIRDRGFTLKGKAYDIDFAAADDEIREIDVREQDGGLPKVFKMESAEQRYFKEWFSSLPPESRVRQCKEMMFSQLNKLNMVDAAELKAYIDRIVSDMDKACLLYTSHAGRCRRGRKGIYRRYPTDRQ